jgi:hypothetical protein
LPFALLNRLRLVPYFVGETVGVHEGRRLLAAAGLRPVVEGAALHCPRAAAVGLASLADRVAWVWPRRALLRLLGGFEWLGRWPTRYLTGYYVTFVADKIDQDQGAGEGP